MKKDVKHSNSTLPDGDLNKKAQKPDSLKRREAIKRIAQLTIGSVAGAVLIGSCEPYSDYEDYYDYYYDYYSRYSRYYDYYSVYSVYWDG